MDEVHLRLGRAIARCCPPGFREAVLTAAMDQPGAALALTCTPEEGGEWTPVLDEADRVDIRAALTEVRHVMGREDGRIWRSCTVTLTKGGGFALDVGY